MIMISINLNFSIMKTLKDLNGVKTLTKTEQRSIKGGVYACGDGFDCPNGWTCPVDYHTPGSHECMHKVW
jgi:hypothetical protein